MKKFGFHHIALAAVNADETVKFYQEALGLEILRKWETNGAYGYMLDMGDGGILEIFPGGNKEVPVNADWLHLALSTDDVDGAYEACLKAGATSHMVPQDIVIQSEPPMPARIAFVKGLNGEQVEFFQEK